MINKVCPKCGSEIGEDYKFCPSCGNSVTKSSDDLEDWVLVFLKQKKAILAIKYVRAKTGMELKEAADYVKSIADKNNMSMNTSFSNKSLVIISVALVLLISAAVYLIMLMQY